MFKKIGPYLIISLFLLSCNKVIDTVDEVRMKKRVNITYEDYNSILDDYDRKIYYDKDRDVMTGHFMVVYNGKPSEEFQTKRGFLNGIYSSYNPNGELTKSYNFIDGKQEGVQREFYASGKLLTEANFEKGKLVGEKITYNTSGEIIGKLKIENGIEYKHYYYHGKMVMAEFKKEWKGKELEMLINYDAFENIQFAFGKSSNPSKKNILYFFDVNLQVSDSVDITVDSQKAAYYYSLIKNTTENVID